MHSFIQRFRNKINGVISGFDRIVFKGCFRPIAYADGAMAFLRYRGVLNKNYKQWAMAQSDMLEQNADRYARKTCGQGIEPIASSHKRKEAIAHQRQRDLGIKHGLIGVWSCVEACSSFRACYDAKAGVPQLRHKSSRCKHLYFYYDHPDYGFMSVRLQTWFPYGIQIALNGREWLRRSLEKRKIEFIIHGNKFLHIADYAQAQKLLSAQLDSRWQPLLENFLPKTFPGMERTLGPLLSYSWTLWQSEWATDFIFDSPDNLKPIMDSLARHAFMTGTGDRLLRYMGRPVDTAGQPHPRANPEILTRASVWHDGIRIRHWVDKNSVKLYNEHNVLRAEMTMNNPTVFRVWRHTQGKRHEPKQFLPLRKGVADIPIRAKIADNVNNRFMDQMATVKDDQPFRLLLDAVSKAHMQNSRRIRAIEITGKDREFIQALSDPKFAVSGLTNKDLRQILRSTAWAKNGTEKQLSARISRHLRLMRDHGLIRKMPNQRRYLLTASGQTLTTAINAILAASTQQLVNIAA